MENIDIDKYVNLRRELHSIPEKSGEEYKTASKIIEIVKSFKNSSKLVVCCVQTLVVVDLKGEKESTGEKKIIGFRGDIDGLAVKEDSGLSYKSVFEGRMHARGHDGHIVILLGTIEYLLGKTEEIDENLTFRFLFQPAQETRQGAKIIDKNGFLEGMSGCFALENSTLFDLGTIGLVSKAIYSKSISFNIDVTGKGGHSSMADETRNPVLMVADLVEAIHSISANYISPSKKTVISVGRVDCGHRTNIIPERGSLGGNIRVFEEEDGDLIKERINKIALKLAEAADCSVEVNFTEGEIVLNDAELTDLVQKIASKYYKVSSEGLPAFISEDFGLISSKVPSCFFVLGIRDDSHKKPGRSAKFDFNDAAIPVGIHIFTEIAKLFF